MKVDDLYETPRLINDSDFDPSINDFDLNEVDENHDCYLRLVKSAKAKHLEFMDGNTSTELIRYGDKYILLNHNTEEVEYYVKVEEGSYRLLGRWVCQTEVWRLKLSQTRGVVYYVLNHYLLSKYGVIISDTLQTEMGRELWVRVLVESIAQGYHCYVYQMDSNDLTPIINNRSMREILRDAYGTTKRFESIRLVVSKHPIDVA